MPPPRRSRFGFDQVGRPWEPKFPEAATDRRRAPSEAPDASDEAGWVQAPATSHIVQFKLQDEESDPLVAKYAGAVLRVQFKNENGKSRFTFYQYFFGSDTERARKIFSDLMTSPHPYGEVLYPQVILTGVSYEPYG